MTQEPEPKLFFRIGTVGEKEIFRLYKDNYHGMVVGAHFAAFYNDWTPTFLRKLNKPFFVDPMTYVFARDLQNIKKNDEMRKSYEKLIDWYGPPLKTLVTSRQLIPKDFLVQGKFNTALVNELVSKSLSFQTDLSKLKTPSQESLMKYAKMLEKVETEGLKKPSFLVAPYFFFPSVYDPWYKISLEIAQAAKKLDADPVYCVICASKEILLDKSAIGRIVKDYEDFDGYIVWFSDLDEEDDAAEYLYGFRNFLSALSRFEKPIYLLYGGYFSLLLTKLISHVSGYCRSICYGISKDVDAEMPKGGGAPRRYYFNLTHTKLPESVARSFFSDNPDLLCKCRICSAIRREIERTSQALGRVQQIGRFFDRFDFTESRKHFVLSHFDELKNVSKHTIDEVSKSLEDSYEKSEKLEVTLYGVSNSQLDRWHKALRAEKRTQVEFEQVCFVLCCS